MESPKVSSSEEDLFLRAPRGRRILNETASDTAPAERISFKIGRAKAPEGVSSAELLNSSSCPSSVTTSETAETSQRDLFASQEIPSSQAADSGASQESLNTTSSLDSFRTSTPRKRKSADNTKANSTQKMQRIAEEDEHAVKNGNREHDLCRSKHKDLVEVVLSDSRVRISPRGTDKRSAVVTISSRAKRKIENDLKDSLPDTVTLESPDVEVLTTAPKSRHSLEVVYVGPRGSMTRIARSSGGSRTSTQEVVDVDSEEDNSLHLYLSQTQSQTQSATSQERKNASTPISVGGGEKSTQVNGNSGGNDDDITEIATDRPQKSNASIKLDLPKNIIFVGDEDSPDHMTSSYSTFAKVRDISEKKGPSEFVSPEKKVVMEESVHTATFTLTWKCIKNALTSEVICRERLQCIEIPDETSLPLLCQSDVSPGVLADVSKNSSPASATSTGLFALPAVNSNVRASIVSTVSSSSSSSVTSAAGLQAKNIGTAVYASRSMTGRLDDLAKSKDITVPQEKLLRIETSPTKMTSNTHFLSPKNGSNLRNLRKPSKQSLELLGVSELPVVPSSPAESNHVDHSSTPSTVEADKITPANGKGSPVTPAKGRTENVTPVKGKASGKASSRKAKLSSSVKTEPSCETPKSSTKKVAAVQSRGRYKRGAKSSGDLACLVEKTPEPKTTGKRRKTVITPPPSTPTPAVPIDSAAPTTVAAFARWTDRRYYSGTVVGTVKDGRCSVKFDDGTTKTLPEECVIRVRELPKNLSVYAKVNSRDFESGYITSFKVEEGVVLCVVDLDSGKSVTVPRSALNMTEDQAQVLKEDLSVLATACASTNTTPKHSRATNINMDNIVYRKRNRKGNDSDAPSNLAEPVTPRSDMSDAANTSVDEISGVDMEYFPSTYPSLNAEGLSKGVARVKGRGRGNTNAPKKTDEEEITRLLGPIPPAGCKMFAGMRFLFTSNGRTTVSSNNSDVDESNMSECETNFSFSLMPFVKERLITQITQGGGTVCSRFEELTESKGEEKYLLSNGPCQTANYLLCLANMIPTVAHDYIVFCTKSGKRLPIESHYLPAGFSVEKEMFIPANDRNPRRVPLRNMSVVLASDDDPFVAFWSKVLECAGAHVSVLSSETVDKPRAEDVDVIMADHTFTSTMMAWAMDVGITVVSSEWAKQCVINWDKCNVRGKTYQYSRLYSS